MDSNIEIHQPDYDDDEEDEDDDDDDIMESSNRYSQPHIVNGNGNSRERAPRSSYADEREHTYENDRKARVVSTTTADDFSAGYAGLGAEFGRGMGRRR